MTTAYAASSAYRFIPPIAEDHPVYYALTCLPFIGAIVNHIQESSIHQQIQENISRPQQVIALLEVKNKYKMASITHHVLWIAALIVGTACKIFSPVFGILFIIPWAALIATRVSHIKANRESIQEIRRDNSVSPFMLIF